MKASGLGKSLFHRAPFITSSAAREFGLLSNQTSTSLFLYRTFAVQANKSLLRPFTDMKARLLLVGLFRTVSAFASSESKSTWFGSTYSGRTLNRKSTTHHSYSTAASTRSSTTALASYDSNIDFPSSRQSSSTANNNGAYYHDQYETHHHHDDNDLPQLTLRLARRADVQSMQKCNLATLPENYNEQFYVSHLQQWPELALVVVLQERKQHPLDASSPYSSMPSPSQQWTGGPLATEKVVAYVLGKIEERALPVEETLERYQDDYYYPSPQQDTGWYDGSSNSRNKFVQQQQRGITTISYGHVTSLAVLEPFRRQGLARELMQQLHAHLNLQYGNKISRVGLHVRAGNKAATRLYNQAFGYQVMERISQYYQDGEDGLLMEMDLKQQQTIQPRQQQDSSTFLGNLWGCKTSSKSGSHSIQSHERMAENPVSSLRLPRQVGLVPPPRYQQQEHRQDEHEEPMHMSY
jgi:ribosomal protein S18 acetylase RimI-like enzyme